jgi:hypothetical protein
MLKEWAHTKSFEEIERKLGITEISFDRTRYPISNYYKIET